MVVGSRLFGKHMPLFGRIVNIAEKWNSYNIIRKPANYEVMSSQCLMHMMMKWEMVV